MKRPLFCALIIGAFACAVIMGLHASGALLRLELGLTDFLSRQGVATRLVGEKWQYPLVFGLATIVAWLTLQTPKRLRFGAILAALFLELIGLAWICSLYRVFFQPLPSIGGVALGFLIAAGSVAFLQMRTARGTKKDTPALLLDTLAREEPARIEIREPVAATVPQARGPAVSDESSARAFEVTAVVCDIADKHDVAEECAPAVFAAITEKFIAHAMETLRDAGAYIESAGGEGVVAIFGFPDADTQHAEHATRKAMTLSHSFSEFLKTENSESPFALGVHAGVSSGTMVMVPVRGNGRSAMLVTGEPVELARRFCIANRFYGSRVLLGPRTFELASKILVARPIDFLTGVDVRERHEIYEPLALAVDASREEITRRDAFWNAVVLYREKRWAEAYAQFQKARGPGDETDRPLQLYLRRLEPLALQLTDSPLDD